MVNLGLFSGSKTPNAVILSFKIPYFTQWGEHILVSGSEPVLGSWNVKKGLLLKPSHQGDELIWSGNLPVRLGLIANIVTMWHDYANTASDDLPLRSAFKNVIFRKSWNPEVEGQVERPLKSVQNLLDHNVLKSWEAGRLRMDLSSLMPVIQFGKLKLYGKYGKAKNFSLEIGANRELFVDFSASQPKYIVLSDGLMREMPWRGAGVAIPMFSVRSDADVGVGEFLDLKLLVDWAVESGFHLVQLLPINDTSVHGMWWDSYPYSSLSVFALHPLYLRVQALTENISADIMQEIQRIREQLDGKDVDYEATMAAKLSIAKKIFSQEKEIVFSSVAYQNFFSENQDWLKPYAAFCFLRNFFETSDHSQWGRFSLFSKDKLSEASEYARTKGVVLKGDLPIGVDRNSVDTWVYPNLFRMNTSTGAPPDYFDKNGQNWGFPTYNWEEMSKDNYGWWRARLTQMAKYFTAYRIDHILGFFRIWELPDHAMTGLCGKFRPSIPLSQEELEREGIWDFNRLSRPYIKQQLLQEKFGASWTIIASSFLDESQKGHYEVCAPSCHDCSTLRAWWEEDEERRRRFFETVVGSDLLPPDRCTPEIAHFVLRQHVESPSMWSIFPLQDLLALKEEYMTRPAVEETINDPTNPKHYWRYRAHVTIESLLKDRELISVIKGLVHGSGRSCPPSQDDELLLGKSSRDIVKPRAAYAKEEETPFASQLNGIPKKEAVTVP
ncbi:hypothetical protein DH2020_039063 [Rehmannia glutinosa]|uniref:4-alpha-glucanotransferase n=1 Tax=Rehmannia glutinosa TaxID=99300 RepID=A0ABR0UWU6_REHGL